MPARAATVVAGVTLTAVAVAARRATPPCLQRVVDDRSLETQLVEDLLRAFEGVGQRTDLILGGVQIVHRVDAHSSAFRANARCALLSPSSSPSACAVRNATRTSSSYRQPSSVPSASAS